MHRSLTPQLAADRRDRLVREAETARLAGPAPAIDPVVDASGLHVRVLDPSDIDAIAALFRRLSARSRYLRFMSPIHSVSAGALRHLADVDHERHEAVGAFHDGMLVGAARSFRRADDPTCAEIAVEISDEYQRHGLGTRLLRELAALARTRGITHFSAGVLHENTGALAFIRGTGWPMTTSIDGAELRITLALDGRIGDPDHRVDPDDRNADVPGLKSLVGRSIPIRT